MHEGEFVANHQAVENPAILPFLNFLDQAQRNNSVGSLKAEDVSNVMGSPASQVLTPIINVSTPGNEGLGEALSHNSETLNRLADRLEEGIETNFDMEKFHKKYTHYKHLQE